jgi:hypothetical protein
MVMLPCIVLNTGREKGLVTKVRERVYGTLIAVVVVVYHELYLAPWVAPAP